MFEGVKKSGVSGGFVVIRHQSNPGKDAIRIKRGVVEPDDREGIVDRTTALLRDGAQQRIPQAVGAELEALLAEHGGRRTAAGASGIGRNGFLPERELQIGVGPVTVRIPKVRSRG